MLIHGLQFLVDGRLKTNGHVPDSRLAHGVQQFRVSGFVQPDLHGGH
jgi:hypothetical protein